MKNKIQTIERQIQELNNSYQKSLATCEYIEKELNSNTKQVEELELSESTHRKAVVLLEKVQEVTKEKTKKEFESLVTYILQYVTEEDYQFKLNFSQRGNLQEMEFGIINPKGVEIENIVDQSGGGLIDLISFGLRIILMETSKIKGPIIADEPFKHLSGNYLERIPMLLDELNKRLNRQFIIISHEENIIENGMFNNVAIK